MERNFSLYKNLFTSTFALSAFTFGGGYVIVPLMKEKYVDKLGWIDEEEMLNLIAISQSSPGAIAINASITLGYKIGGVLGSICTILGAVLPPLITISIISAFYSAFRDNDVVSAVLMGMKAGVAAVIANVVFDMTSKMVKTKSAFNIIIMLGAFCAQYILKINVIFIIITCALIGISKAVYNEKKVVKAQITEGDIGSKNYVDGTIDIPPEDGNYKGGEE